jgi:uncharacterized protein
LGLTATPLETGARIAALDAIRGVALLGILLANVRQMFLPWDIAAFAVPGRNGSDLLAWLDWGFFDSLVDLKFITLFSLLFGAGFALQGERLAGRDVEFAGIYVRRLAMLALFGLAHGLLFYPAEVLLPYAIAGTLLYAARGLSTENLYRIGVVLIGATIVWGFQLGALGRVSVPITIATVAALAVAAVWLWGRSWRATLAVMALILCVSMIALLLHWDPQDWGESVAREYARAKQQLAAIRASDPASWPHEFSARQQGGVGPLLRLHAEQYSLMLAFFGLILLWRTLGLFMVGAALARSGVIRNASLATWRRVSLIGLGIGLPLSLVATVLQSQEIQGHSDWRWPEWLHVASAFPLAIGLGARVMLNATAGRRRWWYVRMESAGRMALSNYVGQSIVMATLAEPWGFGLYGQLGGPTLTALAFVVFFTLATLSHAWLAHYRMGPLEWLWRCGTYARWLPNRLAA